MYLSLVWTLLHMFEKTVLLDTELVELRYAMCFGVSLQGVLGFFHHSL